MRPWCQGVVSHGTPIHAPLTLDTADSQSALAQWNLLYHRRKHPHEETKEKELPQRGRRTHQLKCTITSLRKYFATLRTLGIRSLLERKLVEEFLLYRVVLKQVLGEVVDRVFWLDLTYLDKPFRKCRDYVLHEVVAQWDGANLE